MKKFVLPETPTPGMGGVKNFKINSLLWLASLKIFDFNVLPASVLKLVHLYAKCYRTTCFGKLIPFPPFLFILPRTSIIVV